MYPHILPLCREGDRESRYEDSWALGLPDIVAFQGWLRDRKVASRVATDSGCTTGASWSITTR